MCYRRPRVLAPRRPKKMSFSDRLRPFQIIVALPHWQKVKSPVMGPTVPCPRFPKAQSFPEHSSSPHTRPGAPPRAARRRPSRPPTPRAFGSRLRPAARGTRRRRLGAARRFPRWSGAMIMVCVLFFCDFPRLRRACPITARRTSMPRKILLTIDTTPLIAAC